MDEPADPDGRWHAKDQLAHLAWWRGLSARVIASAATGAEPPARPAGDTDDVQNAKIYAETKDLPAADIKRSDEDSWSALEAALEASSEAALEKQHPHHPEAQVWEAVPGLGGHLGAHLMSWFLDHGDPARAEDVAMWEYQFECSLLPEGEKRADANYNLACFYSRVGRVDEAIPLLRESLRFQPSLVEWARKDSDLAAVRDHPEMRALLDGD